MAQRTISWPDGLHGGQPVPTFVNICAGIQWTFDVRFNVLTQTPTVKSTVLGDGWQPLNDATCAAIRDFFITAYQLDPGRSGLLEALKHLAWRNPYNPLAEELLELEHDGKERIDKFFVTYGGAANNALTRATGRLFWQSIAGRALYPGCDCQVIIVLYGPQGCLKSTTLRAIAGDASRFTDQDVVHLPAERQQEALRGRWIVEASELGGFDRHAVEKIKAFISRTHDRARPAWGTASIDQPRSFIIVATTNEMQILRDSTGNRRFLPIEVRRFDIEAVRRDRDQLLAEAVQAFEPGVPLALPEYLWEAAADRTKRYMLDDPLDELFTSLSGDVRKGEERLPFATIWTLLGAGPERRTPQLKRRVVECMRRLGWTYNAKPFRVGDTTHRGFRRPPAD